MTQLGLKDCGSITHRRDVDQPEAEPGQAGDERDGGFIPVTLFVTDYADDGADEAGGGAQAEGDEHEEEEDSENLR